MDTQVPFELAVSTMRTAVPGLRTYTTQFAAYKIELVYLLTLVDKVGMPQISRDHIFRRACHLFDRLCTRNHDPSATDTDSEDEKEE